MPILSLAVATFWERWSQPDAQCLGAMELLFRCSQSGKNFWPYYNKDLSRAVVALLDVLDLSPATTTFTELDQLDPRFFCSHCPAQEFGGTWTRLAFRWRSAVCPWSPFRVLRADFRRRYCTTTQSMPVLRRRNCPSSGCCPSPRLTAHAKARPPSLLTRTPGLAVIVANTSTIGSRGLTSRRM